MLGFDIQTSAIWMSELQAERMVYDEDRNLLALEDEVLKDRYIFLVLIIKDRSIISDGIVATGVHIYWLYI